MMEVAMRRWNGWGDEGVEARLDPDAARFLERLIGPGTPPADAPLGAVVAAVPASRLPVQPRLPDECGVSLDAEDRVRHARGQSLPDWVALRTGRLDALPDAVARPVDASTVRAVLAFAAETDARIIPYGGGSSVVGGVTARPSEGPILTLDLERTAGLHALDERSGLATFGAGTTGPAIETGLATHGLTLGHYPQSWEGSTIGGWVVTRSSGQQSTGYGRIEALFAGGHVEAPAGSFDMPPHPASAAGPDLRHLVLGSEGRLGVLTDVVVRASRQPEEERFPAYFLPDWEAAIAAGRDLAQARLPVSMIRVSTPLETATTLALAGRPGQVRLLRRYLGLRGIGQERCLALVGLTGSRRLVGATGREVTSIIGRHGGTGAPALGEAWRRARFRAAYLRNTLWEAGYAVDTLETATDWATIGSLAAALGRTLRSGLESDDERVHAFSHLSHLYPTGSSLYTTYVFRIATDPDETLDRWFRLKTSASRVIVAHGATISHQHGVGADHLPYLAAEKGPLGMAVLGDVARRFDPDGIMTPGVLLGS
jgi:alkyldihydroxyacetonephosphate synthase